ncbi:MAG: TonB-dependent receptor [Pseudomonadota bacterium]
MNMRNRALFAALLTTTCWAASGAQAQEGPSGLAASPNASTQSTPSSATSEAPSQDIVVTGFRASLSKALDVKLRSDHIVDSIVAEDIGKLPDQNIAEAIERIPGVAVSTMTVNGNNATAGEPTEISVRGLSPEFTTALYNGRVLATDSNGREFNFDILPAELIARVDVSKSVTAEQPEGGIAATVDMITARPLDLRRNTFVVSAQGNYDQQRGQISPQGSALFSTKTADGRFGALVSFSYIDRKVENRRIYSDGYQNPQTVNTATVPGGVQGFGPAYTEYEANATNRRRISGEINLQFRPTDTLLITADGLYSKLDVNDNTQAFFTGNNGQSSGVTVNGNHTITGYTGGTSYSAIVNYIRPELAVTKEAGINIKFDPSSRLSMTLDGSWSTATNNNGGNQSWFESDYGALPNATYSLGPNNLPVFTGLGDLSPSANLKTAYHALEGQDFSDEIYQGDFKLRYKIGSGIFRSIQAGANYSERTKGLVTVKTPDNVIALFQGLTLPSNLYSPVSDVSNLFGTGMFQTPFPGFRNAAVMNYLLSPAVVATLTPGQKAALDANGGGFGAVVNQGASGQVKERTAGGFVEASFGGSHWSGNIGVRLTHTDTDATGVFQAITGVTYTDAGYPQVSYGPVAPHTQSGSYTEVLPAANFKDDLTSNLMLQVAVAKTLTRPTLYDLMIMQSVNARQGAGGLTIAQGNPGLKPMKAWNFDAALTWHRKSNFLSVALFQKSLSDLEYTGTTTQQIAGQTWTVTQPLNLNSSDLIGVEVSGQYTFTSLPAPFDGLGVQANASYVHPSGGSSSVQGYVDTDPVTYNLIGFYEKGPIQFRMAYNWRNAYISQHNAVTLNGRPYENDLFVSAYGELDASLNIAVTKNLTVFVQALNLNNERAVRYWGTTDRIGDYEGYGRRFGFGARAKF